MHGHRFRATGFITVMAALGGSHQVLAQPGVDQPLTTTPTPAAVPAPVPQPAPPLPPAVVYVYGPPAVPPPPPDSGQLAITGDAAALGLLASIAIIDGRDIRDDNVGTLLVFAGILGGGGAGYLLTEKFKTTTGQAHFTTTAMVVGAANGVLLAQPLGLADSSEEWLPLVLGTTALGLGAGFAVAHQRNPTPGQGTFVATTSLLGVGTAGLVLAAADDDDVDLGDGAFTAVALGLDAGAVTGTLLAPTLDWSRRRSYYVGAGAAIGMTLGAMIGALVAGQAQGSANQTGDEVDPDSIALSMLLGMWGGFAGGVFLTSDMAPDPAFARPAAPTAAPIGPAPVAVGPTVLPAGGLGLGASGQF